jgi:hypothetical protein
MRAVPLHNDNGQAFHDLIGSKTALAGKALTATANAQTVFAVSGIYDLAFLIATKRTSHTNMPPSADYYIIIADSLFSV